jgi:methylglutaconyl-CoA hydratase
MSDELKVELSACGVLRMSMNRPDKHNAFDDHQVQRMLSALEAAQDNNDVKVIVIAGEGRSFSAGGDLNYMRRMGGNTYEENLKDASELARLMSTIYRFPKPTIARVQGAALGGGVGIVSCCDIAIGSDKARFCLSEVKIGMVPATIAPYVVSTIGEKAAKRYFSTAEVISADKALALGLLSERVDESQLDEMIDTVTSALLCNAPNGVRKAKQIVFDVSADVIDENMINHTVKFIADIRHSQEGREGLSAFLEKRAPNWVN